MRNASGTRCCGVLLGLLCLIATRPAFSRAAEASPAASGSVAEQCKSLRDAYGRQQRAASQAYANARGKSDEERAKAYMDAAPNPTDYAQRAMNIVKENPKDPAAVDAMIFVTELARSGDPRIVATESDAIQQLTRDHLDDPKLAGVFPNFEYVRPPAADELMRQAAERSTSPDVRGSAMYWRAQSILGGAERTGDEKQLAEAKTLLQKVAADYADVKNAGDTLGERANASLFTIDHLAVGKVAPPIEGNDADGNPLKLADYRGKVVVLDFWGDW